MDANNQLLVIFSWLMIKTQKIQQSNNPYLFASPETGGKAADQLHALLLLNIAN